MCGYVLLFLLDIKTEDMLKRTFNVRLAAVWEMAVHLAVACDAFGGVLFCAVFFPTR